MISQVYKTTLANTASSQPFILSKKQMLSYGDLDASVKKLTTVFRDRGLAPGDYVFLNLRDDSQLAIIYLACVVNGLAAVVTDPGSPSLGGLASLVKPRLGFVDKGKLESALPSPQFEVIPVEEPHRKTRTIFKKLLKKSAQAEGSSGGTATYPSLLEHTVPFDGDFPYVDPDTTALVLFTSGTTSNPKGVELSHKNIVTQMRVLVDKLRVDRRSQLFNVLPLHHTDGITNGVMLALWAGATLHRPGMFTIHDLPGTMDYIYREGISHLVTVPTVLALIQRLGDDFTDVFQSGDFKVLLSAAGVLPADQWQSFQERFKVRISNGYGLTETVTFCALSGPDDDSFRVGSVGLPLASEVRVVDEANEDVAPGGEGELLVRSDLVMKGYINNPAATAEAFTQDWFHTGDIARIAEDGKIEILGRKKNIIVRGGINIHPAEIADAALEHESVVHAAVYGEPDDIWGEIPVLCIVEDPNIGVADHELKGFLEARLASEKRPGEIHKFADFPRGPAGKVVLRELQEQVGLRKQIGGFSEEGDTLEVVTRIGATLLKVPPASLNRSSSAENVSGWDSLFHLSFILTVEETYSLEFLPRDIMAVRTLGDLVELGDRHRSTQGTSELNARASDCAMT